MEKFNPPSSRLPLIKTDGMRDEIQTIYFTGFKKKLKHSIINNNDNNNNKLHIRKKLQDINRQEETE